jgi:hypothetical protein
MANDLPDWDNHVLTFRGLKDMSRFHEIWTGLTRFSVTAAHHILTAPTLSKEY